MFPIYTHTHERTVSQALQRLTFSLIIKSLLLIAQGSIWLCLCLTLMREKSERYTDRANVKAGVRSEICKLHGTVLICLA